MVAQEIATKTRIVSHGEVETEACETYGQGEPILRIG